MFTAPRHAARVQITYLRKYQSQWSFRHYRCPDEQDLQDHVSTWLYSQTIIVLWMEMKRTNNLIIWRRGERGWGTECWCRDIMVLTFTDNWLYRESGTGVSPHWFNPWNFNCRAKILARLDSTMRRVKLTAAFMLPVERYGCSEVRPSHAYPHHGQR